MGCPSRSVLKNTGCRHRFACTGSQAALAEAGQDGLTIIVQGKLGGDQLLDGGGPGLPHTAQDAKGLKVAALSRGHGRVERAIRELFDAHPDLAFVTDELAEH